MPTQIHFVVFHCEFHAKLPHPCPLSSGEGVKMAVLRTAPKGGRGWNPLHPKMAALN